MQIKIRAHLLSFFIKFIMSLALLIMLLLTKDQAREITSMFIGIRHMNLNVYAIFLLDYNMNYKTV